MNINQELYKILTTKYNKALTQKQISLLESLGLKADKGEDNSSYDYYAITNLSNGKVIVISKNNSGTKAMFSPWWQINNSDKNIKLVDIFGFLSKQNKAEVKNATENKVKDYKSTKRSIEYHSRKIEELSKKIAELEESKIYQTERLEFFENKMKEIKSR